LTQILDGIIAGLASITPAAGYVTGMSSVAIGAISGFLSFFGCIHFRRFFRIDDALNVAMVHGIPSLIGLTFTQTMVLALTLKLSLILALQTCLSGILSLGLVSSSAVNPRASNGLFYMGTTLIWHQCTAVALCALWTFSVTLGILFFLDKSLGVCLRHSEEEEILGLDRLDHNEQAYYNSHSAAIYETAQTIEPPESSLRSRNTTSRGSIAYSSSNESSRHYGSVETELTSIEQFTPRTANIRETIPEIEQQIRRMDSLYDKTLSALSPRARGLYQTQISSSYNYPRDGDPADSTVPGRRDRDTDSDNYPSWLTKATNAALGPAPRVTAMEERVNVAVEAALSNT